MFSRHQHRENTESIKTNTNKNPKRKEHHPHAKTCLQDKLFQSLTHPSSMTLKLDQISQIVGGQRHLHALDMVLVPNAVTVLLGATQAGKTSLMRLMAGLDQPTTGRVWVDGQDITGVPVRDRNVAMVYQQFINYPSMTVYDNIASPLRLRKDKDIDAQVQALAKRLRIDPFLKRLARRTLGRPAAARGLGEGVGQTRPFHVFGRAFGQFGLQTARRTARRPDPVV
jgi:ABC-type thiamine transport system ATPase subunit